MASGYHSHQSQSTPTRLLALWAVVESCGIQNVLTKSIGSANSHNVVRATFAGLKGLKDPGAVRKLRGKEEQEGDLAATTR